MQPLHKEPVRLPKLLGSYATNLFNAGIDEKYSVEIGIYPDAESVSMECDARLISRVIGNLLQNSIRQNPQGCMICLRLDCSGQSILLTVADNDVGLSDEKMRERSERPHYMESVDERLDLRHGLGLLLVRQIAEARGGTVEIVGEIISGWKLF